MQAFNWFNSTKRKVTAVIVSMLIVATGAAFLSTNTGLFKGSVATISTPNLEITGTKNSNDEIVFKPNLQDADSIRINVKHEFAENRKFVVLKIKEASSSQWIEVTDPTNTPIKSGTRPLELRFCGLLVKGNDICFLQFNTNNSDPIKFRVTNQLLNYQITYDLYEINNDNTRGRLENGSTPPIINFKVDTSRIPDNGIEKTEDDTTLSLNFESPVACVAQVGATPLDLRLPEEYRNMKSRQSNLVSIANINRIDKKSSFTELHTFEIPKIHPALFEFINPKLFVNCLGYFDDAQPSNYYDSIRVNNYSFALPANVTDFKFENFEIASIPLVPRVVTTFNDTNSAYNGSSLSMYPLEESTTFRVVPEDSLDRELTIEAVIFRDINSRRYYELNFDEQIVYDPALLAYNVPLDPSEILELDLSDNSQKSYFMEGVYELEFLMSDNNTILKQDYINGTETKNDKFLIEYVEGDDWIPVWSTSRISLFRDPIYRNRFRVSSFNLTNEQKDSIGFYLNNTLIKKAFDNSYNPQILESSEIPTTERLENELVVKHATDTSLESTVFDLNRVARTNIVYDDTILNVNTSTINLTGACPQEFFVNNYCFDEESAGQNMDFINVSLPSLPAANVDEVRVNFALTNNEDNKFRLSRSTSGQLIDSDDYLVFNEDNWNIPQKIYVSMTGKAKFGVNLSQISLVSNTINVVNPDPDPEPDPEPDPDPGIVAPISNNLTEGNSADFQVKLSAVPTANVVLNVTSADPDRLTVDPTRLTFTPTDWNENQTIRIRSLSDTDLADNRVNVTLSVVAANSAAEYRDVQNKIVVVDIDDTTEARGSADDEANRLVFARPQLDPADFVESSQGAITVLNYKNTAPEVLVDRRNTSPAEFVFYSNQVASYKASIVSKVGAESIFTPEKALTPGTDFQNIPNTRLGNTNPITINWDKTCTTVDCSTASERQYYIYLEVNFTQGNPPAVTTQAVRYFIPITLQNPVLSKFITSCSQTALLGGPITCTGTVPAGQTVSDLRVGLVDSNNLSVTGTEVSCQPADGVTAISCVITAPNTVGTYRVVASSRVPNVPSEQVGSVTVVDANTFIKVEAPQKIRAGEAANIVVDLNESIEFISLTARIKGPNNYDRTIYFECHTSLTAFTCPTTVANKIKKDKVPMQWLSNEVVPGVYSVIAFARVNNTDQSYYATANITVESGSCNTYFTDVDIEDDVCEAIEFARELGIFYGKNGPNGTKIADLDATLTRAEFFAIAARLYKKVNDDYVEYDRNPRLRGFRDINERIVNDPKNKFWIEAVAVLDGIVEGYGDGTLRPGANLRMAELAKIVGLSTNFIGYYDDDRNPWYEDIMDQYNEYDIDFDPEDVVTREDAVFLIFDTMDIANELYFDEALDDANSIFGPDSLNGLSIFDPIGGGSGVGASTGILFPTGVPLILNDGFNFVAPAGSGVGTGTTTIGGIQFPS